MYHTHRSASPRGAPVLADRSAATRARFAAEGYERTTLRAVAGEAGVDAAMVIRYFGNKEALFAAAAEFDLRLPDLSGLGSEELSGALLPRFFAVWEEDAAFLALLLRASATSLVAAEKMREVFALQASPALSVVVPDYPVERAGVFGSLILRLAVTRYVLVNAAVADMSREEMVTWVEPVLRQILTGPAPVVDRT